MADNNFTITVYLDGNQSVPRGSTLNIAGTAEPHTFSPAGGVTALRIASLAVSASDTVPTLTLSAAGGLPFDFTWDGSAATPTIMTFLVCADNIAPHAQDIYTNLLVTASGYGTALSADAAGTMINGTWISDVDQLTAVGSSLTYDVTPTINLNQSISYGNSGSYAGSFTFTSSSLEGDNTGLSAVNYYAYISGSDTSRFLAVAGSTGTVTIGNSAVIEVRFDNNYLHASNDLYTIVTVVSTSSPVLSAGWLSSYTPGTTDFLTSEMTLTALGDAGAPSGVSSFLATPGQGRVQLTWTNPSDSDLSAVRVTYVTGTSAAQHQNAGTQIYQGAGTSYEHTGLSGNQAYSYSIFSADNVDKWSSLTTTTSAVATTYIVDTKYKLSQQWPYLTSDQIRRKLVEEGII